MKNIILIFSFFIVSVSFAQNRYIVSFKDKGDVSALNINKVLSPRAIKNHKKNNVTLSESDFPVNQNYINSIAQIGTVVKTSKWLNAVIITSNASYQILKNLPFVSKVEILTTGQSSNNNKFKAEELLNQSKTLNYDSTYKQITQIGVDCMHDKGFLGDGILLAVLDAGFNGMDTILAFDSLFLQNRVVDQYDFIDDDNTVFEKSNHGTMVSSCIAGNQFNYIGSAPNVSLCLYITEDVSREVHEEEFDLIRGLERADSVGADLVNISLGYFKFDTLQGDYTYADMDGETTIAAQGMQIATSKGLVIVTSAGNSGPDHLSTPCDVDSILCVGATDTNSVVASFSSVGPAADGRVKPDVAAIGRRAYCVFPDGRIGPCNGTSFSSPITCGMVACLMQSHPTLTMMDVITSVRQSAHQFNTPDSLLGFGIPNACKADSLLELLEPIVSVDEIEINNSFSIYPNPATNAITILSDADINTIRFYTVEGKLVKQLSVTNSNAALINCTTLKKGMYIVKVNQSLHKRLVIQ